MASDIQGSVREILASDGARRLVLGAVDEAVKSLASKRPSSRKGTAPELKSQISGAKGIAAGAAAAALVPFAAKGIGRLARGRAADALAGAPGKAVAGAASKVGESISSKVGEKLDEVGGSDGGVPGVGKGRRMPVQQSIDIAVPLETVYNQWTQFELWPTFMHRVTRVTHKDDCTVKFATKIWGKTKQFTARIETQRPDERIRWRVSEGITHTGVISFHEVAPRLTRVELTLDVEPGGLLEKAARGMRHIKRASRADLHRFKAFIEMAEKETGAWRGVIEDGKVVKKHTLRYDKGREYGSLEEMFGEGGGRGSARDGHDPEHAARRRRTASGSQSRGRQTPSGGSSRRKTSAGRSRAASSSSSGNRSGNSRRSSSGNSRGSSSGGRKAARTSSRS
jgi:uncharacterized membrane protein